MDSSVDSEESDVSIEAEFRGFRGFSILQDSAVGFNTEDESSSDSEESLEALPMLNSSTHQNKAIHFENDLLYFVLHQQNVIGSKLDFGQLKGQEKLISEVLQSCSFLDVHLAVITQEVTQLEGGRDRVKRNFKIGQWTNSTDGEVDLKGLEIDFVEQLVTGAEKLINPIHGPDAAAKVRGIAHRYQNAVLAIWPKEKTQFMYAKYGFKSSMDRIEKEIQVQLSSKRPGAIAQLVKRVDLVRDLNSAVDSYRILMLNTVWPVDRSEESSSRTRRLLQVCTRLRAKAAGLAVLDLIASASSDRQTSEEVYHDSVLQVIANFVTQVAGKQIAHKILIISLLKTFIFLCFIQIGKKVLVLS